MQACMSFIGDLYLYMPTHATESPHMQTCCLHALAEYQLGGPPGRDPGQEPCRGALGATWRLPGREFRTGVELTWRIMRAASSPKDDRTSVQIWRGAMGQAGGKGYGWWTASSRSRPEKMKNEVIHGAPHRKRERRVRGTINWHGFVQPSIA
jgi:hypothetical protein